MTKRKPMQTTPLDGEQSELVKAILQQVLDSLREDDGMFDSGERLAVCLKKRDVSRLRGALKKL